MKPQMSNECFRAFLSSVSLVDLAKPSIQTVSLNFKKQFERNLKQKQLLQTTVILQS